MQVDSEEIQGNMQKYQTKCLENEPKLKSFLVSPAKAHITLLVLHVEDERLEEAKMMFEEICKENFSNDDIFHVEFAGVGRFGNRVLFAKPGTENMDRIRSMSEIFQSKYSEHGYYSCNFKLDPHLTLLKVKTKKKGLKKIPSSTYEGSEDFKFGIQPFQTIQLLSMTKPASEVGVQLAVP